MFKDLLVVVDTTPEADNRLDYAVALAERFGAHLTGLHVKSFDASIAVAPVGVSEEMMRLTLERQGIDAEVAQDLFASRASSSDLAVEWRVAEGYMSDAISLHARYADLLIVGQHRENAAPEHAQPPYLDELLLTVGRPVLVVPFIGAPADGERLSIARRPLIAWDGSSEAARAVNDALPLLREAESVTVLSVNPEGGLAGEGDRPADDLLVHLARHGILAEALHEVSKDMKPVDVILSRAADFDADLVVMGAYGHSRMREWILGGATRSILQHMTVPVLLSH